MTVPRIGVQAEVDPTTFAAAAAKVRDQDGFHVVPMQSIVEALDELGAPIKDVGGYMGPRTMMSEMQAMTGLGGSASEGVAGEPAATQAPVGTTASSPNAGLDAGEEPATSSGVEDETDARLEYLEVRMAELDDVYLTSQQARTEYFHLLMKIAESRWANSQDVTSILDRIEKMLTHMRYAEDEWPKPSAGNA